MSRLLLEAVERPEPVRASLNQCAVRNLPIAKNHGVNRCIARRR